MWCCSTKRSRSSEPSPAKRGRVGWGPSVARVYAWVMNDRASRGPHPVPPPSAPQAGEGFRSFLLVLTLLLVSACGFQPLYGTQSGAPNPAVDALAETRVALIPDRIGQELRNNLLDRLTPRGQPAKPRYELLVAVAERRDNLGIAIDDSATYGRLTVTTSFTLRDLASNQPVYTGQSRWTNGFTMVSSHFANITNEANARSRALQEISEDIRQQLGVHFAKPGV
jgi:LPS-assembly lipoprotein